MRTRSSGGEVRRASAQAGRVRAVPATPCSGGSCLPASHRKPPDSGVRCAAVGCGNFAYGVGQHVTFIVLGQWWCCSSRIASRSRSSPRDGAVAVGVRRSDDRPGESGFGEPTVLFIASLFVVSEGLDSTGVTAWVGQQLINRAGSDPRRIVLSVMSSARCSPRSSRPTRPLPRCARRRRDRARLRRRPRSC